MMSVGLRVGVLACVWMVLACGAGDRPPNGSAWAGTREQAGGFEVVRNPDAPLFSEDALAVERMAHRVHLLEAAGGRWTHSIGRKGGGPGELERPFGLALSGAELVVGDGGKASLERFGPEGEYRGSLHLGELGFSIYALGGESFLVNSLLGREGGWKRMIPNGEVMPFAWPDSAAARSAIGTECSRASLVLPDQPE